MTPPRAVRVSDELWSAVKEAAERQGQTVTDVIVSALERYVKRHAAPVDIGPASPRQP